MVKSFPGTLKEGGGRGEYSHDFVQFHLLAQTFIISSTDTQNRDVTLAREIYVQQT